MSEFLLSFPLPFFLALSGASSSSSLESRSDKAEVSVASPLSSCGSGSAKASPPLAVTVALAISCCASKSSCLSFKSCTLLTISLTVDPRVSKFLSAEALRAFTAMVCCSTFCSILSSLSSIFWKLWVIKSTLPRNSSVRALRA